MIFQRTFDLDLVTAILTEPWIWPNVGDDFAPPHKEFQANQDARIWYVLAVEGKRVVGLVTLLPRSTVLWEVHIALLRDRTSHGTAILPGAFEWMFENSTALRIIAEVPECNRLAVKLAERTMARFGTNPESFMKHGKLQDLLLFGIDKCPR